MLLHTYMYKPMKGNMLEWEEILNHSGKIGSLVTVVPLPPPPLPADFSEVKLLFLQETELDLEGLLVLSLKGRICNLVF